MIHMKKHLPKINHFVIEIFTLYSILTLICAVLYFISGMNSFDAIAHAMTTISTGGFSTHNESFSYFDSIYIESTSIVFMIVGSLPFVVFIKFIHGDLKSFFKDDQIKLFFIILFTLISFFTFIWM